jgi:Mg2+-importing ATPase
VVLGRACFANTLKYISVTASSNLGNMISMAVASLALPFLPMLAKQILLNNLLADLPMLAIATDAVDEERLSRPGRWDFRQLLRTMVSFGLTSSLFDGLTFATLLVGFGADAPMFQTGWFVESLLSQLAIIAVMRTRKPFWRSRPSRPLLVAAIAVMLLALALPYLPFSPALGFVPLGVGTMGALAAIVIACTAASELVKNRLNAMAGNARVVAKRR